MSSASQSVRASSFLAALCFWLGSIVFGIHIAAEGAITSSPTSYEHGPVAFVIGTCMVSVFLVFMAIGFLIAVIVFPKTPKTDSRRLYGLSGSLGILYAGIMSGYWVISRVFFPDFSLVSECVTLFWIFCLGFPLFSGLIALWIARRVGFLGRSSDGASAK